MFFILKLVLIILLNETYAYIAQDIEKILLPALNSTSVDEIPLTLKVFGKQIQLHLRRNDQTVSSTFNIWKHDAIGITEELSQLYASDPCYYLHKDHISTAAINCCQEHGWEGFVFLKDDTLEIRPLRDDFMSSSLIDDLCVKEEINISFGKPHLIKRSLQLYIDTSFNNLHKLKRRDVNTENQNTEKKLTIELAVFFDEIAYHMFMPLLDEDKEKLRTMILGYVSRLEAMFHHPSLGVSIDISLVYLEIMDKQPLNLSVYNGDASRLLYSFCTYAKSLNSPSDIDSHHWDIGLYLTGKNIFNRAGDYSIVGISNSDSVCDLYGSCVVAEFSITRGIIGLSGFTSTLTAAHEIAHTLGMKHDSEYLIPCHTYDHIMSFNVHHLNRITWSKCSRKVAKALWNTKKCLRDHTRSENLEDAYAFEDLRYHNLPGREWTAKAQCELFLRDKDANVVSLVDICKMLQCESPNFPASTSHGYIAGSALRGTRCEFGKECRGGECLPVNLEPPYIFKYCDDDNWSEWKMGTCQSSCLKKSQGIKIKRRSCKHGSNKTANCEEPYYDVILCNDALVCKTTNRKTVDEFSAKICKKFIQMAKDANLTITLSNNKKDPFIYDVNEPWIACTIHCQKEESSDYYTARFEMLNFNINPYLPDGTWCHHKNNQDYYCRQHNCLPERYSYSK